MLKFYYNGIKDNGGKLQLVSYSDGKLCNYPDGTITIYVRHYRRLSEGVRAAFTVENGTDIQSDLFEEDRIRVEPSHLLYHEVKAALDKQKAHQQRRSEKVTAKSDRVFHEVQS